jgi:bifunctional non-homologous end joining protein LigD
VLAVVAAHELEGVVGKRLDAPYASGHRARAWIKHKIRRTETLVITAWMPGRPGESSGEFYVARCDAHSELAYAGTVSMGLSAAERERLRAALIRAQIAQPGRRGMRRVEPVIRVVVDGHGRRGQPLRDPVMRAVLLDANALAA